MRVLLFLILVTVSTQAIFAQNFSNPNFTGNTSFGLSTLPSSWQNVPATDPLCQVNPNFQGLGDTPDMTNNLGPMLSTGIAGNPYISNNFISGVRGNNFHEGIMQTVSGFTPGKTYRLSFYQTVVKQENCLDTTGAWSVFLDNSLIGTSAISTSHLAYNDLQLNWEMREILFIASQNTHTFKFFPEDDDANLNITSYALDGALRMGIDQIQLEEVSYPTYYFDTMLCSSGNYTIDLNFSNASYLWNDNSTSHTKVIDSSGIYTVEVSTHDSIFNYAYNVEFFKAYTAELPMDTTICYGDTLLVHSPQNNYNFHWQNNSTSSSISVSETQEITYTMYENNCSVTEKMQITVEELPKINLNDTTLCFDESYSIQLPSIYNYAWNDGSTSPNYLITVGGNYSVETSNGFCSTNTSFQVDVIDSIAFEGFTDTTLCFGEELLLALPQGNFNAEWNDGTSIDKVINQTESLVLHVSNTCQSKDFPVEIVVVPELQLYLGEDTTLCPNETFEIVATSNVNGSFLWQDGGTTANYTVQSPGTYAVNMNYIGCTISDSVVVNYTAPLNIDLGNDTTICSLSQFQLTASTDESVNYYWSDGSTNNAIWVDESAYYTVTVTNNCESVTDEIYVAVEDCYTNVFAPNAFTPNGDRHNNTFQFETTDDFDRFEWQIYNRWGELIYSGYSKEDVWDGTYHNQICQDGSYVWKLTYSRSGSAYVEQKTGTITLLM
ncbi:gliding motility-associated C-terminal domain-containing protein [Lishizhenia tianjinensis]|uniref:Gliding motility-associated C-terminal domain-containing protein n=1 Tax=Lishizhenia tianjinensis TaxID=477690 RepID=A0A1I6YFE6_9FLAO|nr:gliding motility-associated C-terminal domain-containing protein [Lishizhenia tianjinensis]SFT49213.1 gliding motility-associated C-terminal domain-containing protein [Lishizhenia tianjinensis]